MQVGAAFSLDRCALWKDCLLAFPIAFFPSILLYAVAEAVLRAFGADVSHMQAPQRSVTVVEVLGSVLFAPVIETLLLALVLSIVRRAVLVASISAIAFGVLHGMFGLLWFFGTVWSFFVFSCALPRLV